MARRKYLVPEVVQTSNMDCGPASLKCLLEGFGIPVSYGRLREACQTGVDGTSIDTMETVARQLGLDAEQIIVPVDHLLLTPAETLPAIIVVKLPNGLTHFVVIWRQHGSALQVMDPATGRRWPSAARFLKEVYVHTMAVPAEGWGEFATSDSFQKALRLRMRAVGVSSSDADRVLSASMVEWRKLAALDAATRMTKSLVDSGGLPRGSAAVKVLERFSQKPELIPERYWSAKPLVVDGEEQALVRGAVLVHAKKKLAETAEPVLSVELAAALSERPPHPGRELLRVLHEAGTFTPSFVVLGMALASVGVVIEAVLFRGLFDLGHELGLAGQRMGAMAALILFSAALLLFEVPLFSSVLRLGRQIETRMRMAFLDKIPRLGDRYFQSRLTSDMAERGHTTQRLRHLPDLARQILRSAFELMATAAGIIWLDPASAPLVLLAVAAAIVPPFVTQSVLAERDLRLRNHAAALTRYYLDAMLGLIAIRAHGAEPAVRRQHATLLEKWAGAGLALQRSVVSLEAFQLVTILGLIAWLLLSRLSHGAEIGRVLLIVYWALNIPTLGQDIGSLARQLPYYRNLTLRLLEPLGAPEEPESAAAATGAKAGSPRIEFRDVTVQASGQTILQNINLTIESGAQIAILGPSGAGKSTLVGILLGWLSPSVGQVLIDGNPLDAEALRRVTAWVDPAVQLWNRSLFDNLCYGTPGEGMDVSSAMSAAIDAAMLRDVLQSLPDGLQTGLGEGGALVSGGQGQRVRLGRAMLRRDARLVILDEPFRGLDRHGRHELLNKAKQYWKGATLLCVTHDIEETRAFDRVLVVEHGEIIEDASPTDLAARDSRYTQLLQAESDVRTGMWSGPAWRRLRIESGQLVEKLSPEEPS